MKQVMTVLLNVAVHVRLIVKQSFTTLCMFIETDSYNECMTDYHSCTSEQLCQYPEGGPHTCYCKPGYRMIPSGGCDKCEVHLPDIGKVVLKYNYDNRSYIRCRNLFPQTYITL